MRWAELELAPELRPAWLEPYPVRLPGQWTSPPRVRRGTTGIEANFDIEKMLEVLAAESWAKPQPSPTEWFPFPYLSIPGPLRRLAATMIYLGRRWQRSGRDPSWPIAAARDVLLALVARQKPSAWPTRWAISLSHDVDTVHGLRRAPAVAEVVERAGYRSCFFVVADALRAEPQIARELHARGHEIGSHDLHHDNRLYRLSPARQRERLCRARDSIAPFGGGGFRAPSLRRTADMIGEVGRCFEYDSSSCDSDLEQDRGCATVMPFELRGCLELPVTLPTDASLMYLGYGPSTMREVWQRKCQYIRGVGGLAMLVTHTEPHFTSSRRLRALCGFLEWLQQQEDVCVLLPREAAARVRQGEGRG